MPDKKVINNEDLSKVNGGTHLSEEEVKNLANGTILIVEGVFGENLAKVEYLGEWNDPGVFFLMLHVKYLEIYDDDNEHKIGDEVWLPRYLLDFPYRA